MQNEDWREASGLPLWVDEFIWSASTQPGSQFLNEFFLFDNSGGLQVF